MTLNYPLGQILATFQVSASCKMLFSNLTKLLIRNPIWEQTCFRKFRDSFQVCIIIYFQLIYFYVKTFSFLSRSFNHIHEYPILYFCVHQSIFIMKQVFLIFFENIFRLNCNILHTS